MELLFKGLPAGEVFMDCWFSKGRKITSELLSEQMANPQMPTPVEEIKEDFTDHNQDKGTLYNLFSDYIYVEN